MRSWYFGWNYGWQKTIGLGVAFSWGQEVQSGWLFNYSKITIILPFFTTDITFNVR